MTATAATTGVLPAPPRRHRAGLVVFAGVVAMAMLASCGGRTSLSPPEQSDSAGVDAAVEPDRQCPGAARPGGACELAADRRCFYANRERVECRCQGQRWICEPVACDGWGPDCLGGIFAGLCTIDAYCGACCTTRRGRLITGCTCVAGQPPVCIEEDLCRGP